MGVESQNGSFRDPAGFMFEHDGTLYRQVNQTGQADYDLLMSSGLYEALQKEGLMVAHDEVQLKEAPHAYKVIRPVRVPFVSYPYEWTFAQLQQAALLTLEVLNIALKHGMILKDASAYNVQFIGNKPVFIDTLSFAAYEVGKPWEGYKQFCEHFIAPLALVHYTSQDILKTLREYIDGLPLQTVCSLLPARARLRAGLLAHLYIHGNAQKKHRHGGEVVGAKTKERKVSALAMEGLQSSLKNTVTKLRSPKIDTEWGEYYSFTNYSDHSFTDKRKTVAALLAQVTPKPKMIWDIGANNGEFSELAVEAGAYTIAFDIDANAVAYNYAAKRKPAVANNMLPLVQDLTNPSTALGWAHAERMSLTERGPADVVMALALIHHLAIGNNLPLDKIASFLRQIGKNIIIEFVPKEDSKVQHLLASREDIFDQYDHEHFEKAMAKHFTMVTKKPVKGSHRSIYLYKITK